MKHLLKILFISLLIFNHLQTYGKDQEKKSGYGYILKNYFSKRKSNFFNHKGSPRNITLYGGSSFFRETLNDNLESLSFVFGLNQRIKEFPTIGDLNLQVGVESIQLKSHRSFVVEVNPRFTLPDVRSGFPLYIGLGGGVGIFPRHLVKKIPALSVNLQTFAGVRLLDLYYNLGFMAEATAKVQIPLSDMTVYLELLASLGIVFSF